MSKNLTMIGLMLPNYSIDLLIICIFDSFIGSENPETYFTDTERTRVCYEILETAPYGRRQKGEIGRFSNCKVLIFVAAAQSLRVKLMRG